MAVSKETKPSFGGLQIRNINEININLLCEYCKLLQLHPTQVLCCGTRLCRWCSKKGLPDSEPFICSFCHTKQSKKQVRADRGVERDVNLINIECYLCSWHGSYKDYLEHLQQHHAYLECDGCNERFFAVNSFEEHRQEICEYRSIPCGLPGCVELIRRPEMKTHFLCTGHQKLLIQFIIDYVFPKNRSSKNSNRSTTTPNVVRDVDQEMHVIEESIDFVTPGLETLSSDNTRLRTEHDQTKLTCERLISQINETKRKFDQDNEKCLKSLQSQNETEKEFENTNKLYLSTNILSLDIDNTMIFAFHKHSDEINSPFSMYSPIFKTSPYGYSFILRVCSTSENQGYLSIYIALLRGDFDAILPYPFPYNISLYLCDQSGQGKHIKSTIKSDPTSPSFARPTSEKNTEIGIMKFCPLSYLTDAQSIYLRNSVFFTRVFINFMNIESIP